MLLLQIKGNDTLRGDGNLFLLIRILLNLKIRRNDTLKGDGNSNSFCKCKVLISGKKK